MAFRIKTISEHHGKAKTRCDMTVEEIDDQDNPTGREHTEPFSPTDADRWSKLKARFEKHFKADNERIAAVETLRTEANDAKVTQLDLS